jgi:hypothetical protein
VLACLGGSCGVVWPGFWWCCRRCILPKKVCEWGWRYKIYIDVNCKYVSIVLFFIDVSVNSSAGPYEVCACVRACVRACVASWLAGWLLGLAACLAACVLACPGGQMLACPGGRLLALEKIGLCACLPWRRRLLALEKGGLCACLPWRRRLLALEKGGLCACLPWRRAWDDADAAMGPLRACLRGSGLLAAQRPSSCCGGCGGGRLGGADARS